MFNPIDQSLTGRITLLKLRLTHSGYCRNSHFRQIYIVKSYYHNILFLPQVIRCSAAASAAVKSSILT